MEEPGLVAEIYREALDLSPRDREMLIVALKHSLEDEGHPTTAHSITELRGLGKEVWHGIDGQEYVNKLRDEWDERP
jgi:hypothetical protein